MPYYDRKLPRLKSYDYSQPNYYYVTICTHQHRCLFGKPGNLGRYGRIAFQEMESLSTHYEDVRVDKFVVMPNHIHVILSIGCFGGSKNPTLSNVVGQYKSAVSKKIHEIAPDQTVWQKSFYEEVIRGEQHYLSVWNYIDGNPQKWESDAYCSVPR